MPAAKKSTKKKATARKSPRTTAAEARRREQERWDALEKRIIRLAVQFVCVAGLVKELFVDQKIEPQVLLFLATVLGLPTVISQARKADS